jgi:hypothetical protein
MVIKHDFCNHYPFITTMHHNAFNAYIKGIIDK